MAILSVKKGFSGITAGGSETARTTVETYSVVTDSVSDGPLAVLATTDPTTGLAIPTPNTPHPDDAFYLAGVPNVSLICPTFFNVTVPYSTRGGQDQAAQYNDPLAEPAEISWGDVASVEPIDQDADGNAILNAAHEPFDPPPAMDIKDTLLRIKRNEAAFDPDTKLTFDDTTNQHVFWGGKPGRARMAIPAADKVNASPSYWKVLYEITFRMRTPVGVTDEKAWYRRILNQGYRYLDGDGVSHPILEDGQPISQPKLLAADGSILASDADPVWLEFKKYPPTDWGLLGLDTT